MIQRIQTLYLLIVMVLEVLLFVLPFSEISVLNNHSVFYINGFYQNYSKTDMEGLSTLPLFILVVVMILTALATILLYKNRLMQLKLGKFNILITTVLLVTIFYYFDKTTSQLDSSDEVLIHYQWGTFIPIIILILIFLSNMAIKKDEMLVKAADRLR